MSISDVKVTGDIYVPATGTELVTNGDFVDTSSTDSSVAPLAGWTNDGTHDATNKFTIVTGECRCVSDGTLTQIEQAILTAGKTYLLTVDISDITAGNLIFGGQSPVLVTTSTGSKSVVFVADDDQFIIKRNTGVTDVTFDNVSVLELTPGPIDQYPWDSQTDYSAGAEPLGILNGERVYKSVDTHADGAGGADVPYLLLFNTPDSRYYIRQTVLSTEGWFNNALNTVIGDNYTPFGGYVGTAIVSDISAPFSRTRSRYNADGGLRRRIN